MGLRRGGGLNKVSAVPPSILVAVSRVYRETRLVVVCVWRERDGTGR